MMMRPLAVLRHRRLRSYLDAFVDEELDTATRTAVVAHLDECPGCSQVTRQLRRIKSSLRRLRPTELPTADVERMKIFADQLITGTL